ncbi:MAG: hypothetical protein R3C01_11375 [Planctomycetaceae bacterium]
MTTGNNSLWQREIVGIPRIETVNMSSATRPASSADRDCLSLRWGETSSLPVPLAPESREINKPHRRADVVGDPTLP